MRVSTSLVDLVHQSGTSLRRVICFASPPEGRLGAGMEEIRRAVIGDRAAWNQFLASSPDSSYAHAWEWMDLYERSRLARPLALIQETEGTIAGIYSGLLARGADSWTRRLLTDNLILWSPHELTWDYGGPCLGPELSGAAAVRLIHAMEREAKAEGAWCLRISPLSPRISNLLGIQGYEARERLTSIVHLDGDEHNLWKRLDKTFRYEVRKAEGRSLRFETGSGLGILPDFLSCIGPLAAQKGFEIPPIAFLTELLQMHSTALSTWWNAVRDPSGRVLAVGLSICHKDTLTERWGVATDEGKKARANHFRLWNNLVWASKEGFRRYDLGGLPSDPSNEIYRFKSKLRGDVTRVDWYVKYVRMQRLAKAKRKLTGHHR